MIKLNQLLKSVTYFFVTILIFFDVKSLCQTIAADNPKLELKNVSKAFYVDDVAYDLVDAENVVYLYYETVENRRSKSFLTTSTREILVHLNNSQKASATKLNASVKGLAAIEKHLWNIRKNNTRSKINRLLFNRIQLETRLSFGIPKDCSRMVICKEDINAILM